MFRDPYCPYLSIQTQDEGRLDSEAQRTLDSFRQTYGRPVLTRKHVLLAGRLTTQTRRDLARLQSSAPLHTPRQAFLAVYDSPGLQTTDDRQYFCDACAARMPAREQDWRMHIAGVSHQCQMLSLARTGELGHMPSGSLRFCSTTANSGLTMHSTQQALLMQVTVLPHM